MKLFVKLLAGLVALLITTVIVLVTIIDPNDYKEEIQSQVKNTINRELLINGDLGWTFYPQLGFSSGEIELNNLTGFNRKHLLKIENAAIAIEVLPLFKGEIKIGELTLNGLVLNLITNKDGSSNLDNMSSPKSKSTPAKITVKQSEDVKSENGKSSFFAIDKAQLAGVNINNALIEVQDLKAGSTTKVNINHIHLGKFALGQETDLSVVTDLAVAQMNSHIELQTKLIVAADFSSVQLNNLDLQTLLTGKDLPNGKISSSINSDIFYDLTNSKAELNKFILQVEKIKLEGMLSVQTQNKTKVRFSLQGNEWDLNPYLTQAPEKSAAATKPAEKSKSNEKTVAPEQEPDLSFLHGLDIQGTLAIAGVKASGLTIGKINSNIVINQGKAQIKPLTAQLYQGLLTVNGWVDDARGTNKYQLSSKLKDVQIRPLLTDAAEIDLLSGTTAFNFAARGKGLTATKIKSGLAGHGDFKLLDGELYGINIPQEIRTLKAKLTGKQVPTAANIKKTDFASLTGKFSIKNGIVDNNKLLMLSPVMRLDGLGLVDILKESLDYKLSITPLSKSDAQTELYDLNGVTIPLLIKGSFSDPKFSLDMDGALKEQLKLKAKKLEEKAKAELRRQQKKLQEKSQQELKEEGKKLEEKMKKELGRLFG